MANTYTHTHTHTYIYIYIYYTVEWDRIFCVVKASVAITEVFNVMVNSADLIGITECPTL